MFSLLNPALLSVHFLEKDLQKYVRKVKRKYPMLPLVFLIKWTMLLLFLWHGLQQQIVKIKTEVRRIRDGSHLHLVDAPIGVESERHVSIGAQFPIMPAGDERVVLPEQQIADQRRRVRETNHQLAVFMGDDHIPIPGVRVSAGILFERQRRPRSCVAHRRGAFFLFGDARFEPRPNFLVSVGPIGFRRAEIMIENPVSDRLERRARFLIC